MEDLGHHAPSTYVDPRGPVLAVALFGLFALLSASSGPAREGAILPWTLNPTGELNNFNTYVLLYALTIPAKEFLNVLLCFFGRYVLRCKKMDEGESKVRKLEVLEFHDLCYLAGNTVVEFLGMNHTVAFLLSSAVDYRLIKFNLYNGPLAFIFLMTLNDIIYYPFHLVAHRRSLYPYCHKQHHRQFVPFRGYADAANQHPLEQSYGFAIFILSMWITSKVCGLHASTAWCATLAWAILNICNHLSFNSRIHLPLLYPAYPRDHNMHHRFPNCNYSTLSTMMDRFGGTFRKYEPLGAKKEKLEDELPVGSAKRVDPKDDSEVPLTRPEALPSPKSFWALAVALFVALIAVEVVTNGHIANHHELAVFAKSAIFLANVAFICGALDPGDEKDDKKKKTQTISAERKIYQGRYQEEAMPKGFTKRFVGDKSVYEVETTALKPGEGGRFGRPSQAAMD